MKTKKFKQTEIGMIPEDWEETTLGKISTINMGQSPPSNTYNDQGKGLPFFQGNKDFGEKFPIKIIYCSDPKKVAGKGEILFSVRAPVGHVNIAIERCCIGRGVSSFLMKNDNQEFLFYLLRYYEPKFKQIFESEGTVFGCANKEGLNNFEVLIPKSNKEQTTIAKILSSLDSKIELNQQMNKTLEAIGQAIFKRWFIDFEFKREPVELGNFIEFVKGKKPKKIFDYKIDNSLPQILIDVLDGTSPHYAVLSEESVTIRENEPLMVMDGASSGRIEIGLNGILGSTISKIVSKDAEKISNYYIYYFLKIVEEDINQNTTGTSIPHTDKEKIKKYEINLPDKKILSSFNLIASFINNQIINNKKQNQILSQIRDTLLPKLMSGKIRVPVEVRT